MCLEYAIFGAYGLFYMQGDKIYIPDEKRPWRYVVHVRTAFRFFGGSLEIRKKILSINDYGVIISKNISRKFMFFLK